MKFQHYAVKTYFSKIQTWAAQVKFLTVDIQQCGNLANFQPLL